MDNYKKLAEQEKEHLLSMLIAGKLDVDAIERKFLGVAYGDDPKQKMNIYLPPSGEGPFPVIFFLHGGGWQSGTVRSGHYQRDHPVCP